MEQLFINIYNLVQKRKAIWTVILIVSLGFMSYHAFFRLTLSDNYTDVLPESQQIQAINEVIESSKILDQVIFHLYCIDESTESIEQLHQAARNLADTMSRKYQPEGLTLSSSVAAEVNVGDLYSYFVAHLPLFLDSSDYRLMERKMHPDSIDAMLQGIYRTLISPASIYLKKAATADPFGLSGKALKRMESLNAAGDLQMHQGLLTTPDQRHVLIIALPSKPGDTKYNAQLFSNIDADIVALKKTTSVPVEIEYFGAVPVALSNATVIQRDIQITMTLALVLIVGLLIYHFRGIRSLPLIMVPAIIAAITALGALSLTRDAISAISLGIGSVLLGITIDYALHMLTHLQHSNSIERTYKDITVPIVLSSITTAGAFLSLYFISSKTLRDLGFFAAAIVITAAVVTLFILPHLVKTKQGGLASRSNSFIHKLAEKNWHTIKGIKWAIILLSIGFYFAAKHISFQDDLEKSNYQTQALTQARINIEAISDLTRSTVFLVSSDTNADVAFWQLASQKARLDEFLQQGLIEGHYDASLLLLSHQQQVEKIAAWENFWTSERVHQFRKTLTQACNKQGFKSDAFEPFYSRLETPIQPISIDEQLAHLGKAAQAYALKSGNTYHFVSMLKTHKRNELYAASEAAFTANGLLLFDKTLVMNKFMELLQSDFGRLVKISLWVVFLILLVAYGRFELALVNILPLLLSWIWTTGIMALLHIDFNIFNIIITTLVFGLGIDYAVFITRGYIQEHKSGTKVINSYKSSILISALTTIIGIGVLAFARHPALRSIALVASLGIASMVFMVFTLLPAMLNWMFYHKGKKRVNPVTLGSLVFSLFVLVLFLACSVFLNFVVLTLLLTPMRKARKKLFFHRVLQRTSAFIAWASFLIRTDLDFPPPHTYDKPLMVLANHQSHLDLIIMMMLHPKTIILTNNWVWNSPFFGAVVRYADYCNVSSGMEKCLPHLRQKVAEGYSIMVFPEGTRSHTGKIRRFHKGAFLLAQELGLDYLPLFIHGLDDMLSKKEFFLRGGHAHLRYCPIMKRNELGNDYREQAKAMQSFFRAEFEKLRSEFETPEFFGHRVQKSFIYYSPVLEWYTLIKLKIEKYYHYYHSIIPKNAVITDIGCGYGYMSIILAMGSEQRQVTALDYDEEKIGVAAHNALTSTNISFAAADARFFEYHASDVFILSDVLHYLRPAEQEELLEKLFNLLKHQGQIIIREGNAADTKKHGATKLSELFSTRLLGFNKTQNELHFISESHMREFARVHQLEYEYLPASKTSSNSIFILKKA